MAEAGGGSKSGGSGIYLLGLLFLAAGIFGIVYMTRKDAPPAPTAAATPTVSNAPKILNAPAPPPPPKVEDLATAEPSASASAAPSGKSGPLASGGSGGGACSRCGQGKGSGALNSAVAGLARSAQGCYNRALRTSAASGSMTVAVQVGSNGQVCNASIVNDSVGSSEISSCVLGRFQGAQLPPPEEGCVVVNAPITFKLAN